MHASGFAHLATGMTDPAHTGSVHPKGQRRCATSYARRPAVCRSHRYDALFRDPLSGCQRAPESTAGAAPGYTCTGVVQALPVDRAPTVATGSSGAGTQWYPAPAPKPEGDDSIQARREGTRSQYRQCLRRWNNTKTANARRSRVSVSSNIWMACSACWIDSCTSERENMGTGS